MHPPNSSHTVLSQIPESAWDNVPGILLTHDKHIGTEAIGSFHNGCLKKYLQVGNSYNKGAILTGLEQAYNDFGQPNVWKVAKAWLKTQGVQ